MFPLLMGQGMPGEQFMNSYYPFLIAIAIGFFFGIRHYFRGPQWTNVGDLTGKIIIITGANSGIGVELAKIFCENGAKVYMGCRSKERAEEAMAAISKLIPHPSIHFIPLDLASFKSVKAFTGAFLKRESRLDILVNNAGVLAPPSPDVTEDAVEVHFQVNYLSHFLLTHLLLDVLKDTPHSRVVNNTSHAHNLVILNLEGIIDQSILTSQIIANIQSSSVINSQSAGKNSKVSAMGDTIAEAIEDGNEDDAKNSSEIVAKNSSEIVAKNSSEIVAKNSDESGDSNSVQPELSSDEIANAKNRHYAQSKLAMVLFTVQMATLLENKSPTFLVANPGVVFTDIYRHMTFRRNMVASVVATPFMWYLTKTARDGAQTALCCCTSPDLEAKSGRYFVDCAEGKIKENAVDARTADYLYEVSLRVCQKWMN